MPEYHESFCFLALAAMTTSSSGASKCSPPSERERSQMAVQPEVQGKLGGIAGFQTAVFARPSLPGSGGLPFQFVMVTDRSYLELEALADELVGQAMQSGKFAFLKKSVEFNRPKTVLVIDRDRAGDLGISMRDIGANLGALLGGNYVNRFSLEGRSYKVIPQVERDYRLDPEYSALLCAKPAGEHGAPLATHSTRTYRRAERAHPVSTAQLGHTGWADAARRHRTGCDGLHGSAGGRDVPARCLCGLHRRTRQYAQQGSALIITFFMSLLVIYLVLAAQFESWRDPVIILVSVPMSIAGALIFMMLGFATVNIYTQVGLITLIGLVAKNGILIVEFANKLQDQRRMEKREASRNAAAIRLRPDPHDHRRLIVAMVPLFIATGAGAVSRFHIGLVIASGLGIGTLFTLFVVPAVYLLMAPVKKALKSTADEDPLSESG